MMIINDADDLEIADSLFTTKQVNKTILRFF